MGLRGGFEWDGGTWKKRLIINTAALTRLPGMGLEIPQASEASMQWFKPSQLAPTLNYRPADYVRDINKMPKNDGRWATDTLKMAGCCYSSELIPLTRSIVKCKVIRDELMQFLLSKYSLIVPSWLTDEKQPNTMRRTSNSWSKCKYTKPGCCRARVPIMGAKLSTNLLKRARKKSWIYHRKSALAFESH